MKQEDVAALAGLLNSTAEEVSQAIENGTVSEIINGFLPTVKIFAEKDYATLQENLRKQALLELDKTKLPKDVYDYVKGSVLEKTEKELARQYGVSEYQNLNSLVEQIIATKTKTNPDDETKQLKQRIVEVESEYQKKLEQSQRLFETKYVESEINRVINELPIEAEGERLTNQQDILRTMIKSKLNFNLDGEKVVAVRDGKPITDTKLDPVPIKDVIYEFAKSYVNLSPVGGGRGDESSQNANRTIDFAEYCEKNGLRPNSVELVKARKDLLAKGYKLI